MEYDLTYGQSDKLKNVTFIIVFPSLRIYL